MLQRLCSGIRRNTTVENNASNASFFAFLFITFFPLDRDTNSVGGGSSLDRYLWYIL